MIVKFDIFNDSININFKKWFGDSKVVDENNNPIIVYHGTDNEFDYFDYNKIGLHATGEGYGFYFSNVKSFAKGYTKSNKILECYIKIENPISLTKKTISKIKIKNLIKNIDPTGDDFLSNFGDISIMNYTILLNKATNDLWYNNDNDVDLISEIINVSGHDYELVYGTLQKLYNYDGIINKKYDVDDGTEIYIYIVFNPNQIKSIYNNGNFSQLSNNIFESANKIDILRNKYKDISDSDFNILVDADPSNNKQYLDWILKCYVDSKDKKLYLEDAYKIREYLKLFTEYKNKNRIEVKDITKYKDYKDLYKTLSEIGGLGKPTENEHYLIEDRYYINNKEAKLFYEDNNYLIVIPKTLSASKFYAKNTQWCTRFPDNFKEYSSDGDLYIIIDKQLLNTDNLNRRLQFHFESTQFMNFNDQKLLANIKSKFLNIFKDITDSWKLKYDWIDDFDNDFAGVKLNGKFGFINLKGEEICPIIYDNAYNFKNGFTKVKLNNKWLYIDEHGNEYDELPNK